MAALQGGMSNWFPIFTRALVQHFPGATRSCALEHWFRRADLEALQLQRMLVEGAARPGYPSLQG